MRIAVIVQARMNSERLPGKVLKEVLGKPLLGYELERLRRVRFPHTLVVATSVNPADDPLEAFCSREKVACARGPEQDVLARFYQAAALQRAEAVVRVTGDCPLVDPEVVDKVVNHYLQNAGRADYVSNVLRRTYPRGLDCEVFSFKALQEAHREATDPAEREHVTPFIYGRPERYRLSGVENKSDLSAYRWTVDTAEDFELIKKIVETLIPMKPAFGMRDILEAAARHPEWKQINARVEQKTS